MTDDGVRTTSTKLTDTFHGHGHETLSETVFGQQALEGFVEERRVDLSGRQIK